MEYIVSIRSGATTVAELIKILQQFNENANVFISVDEERQLDLYRLEDGDLDIL